MESITGIQEDLVLSEIECQTFLTFHKENIWYILTHPPVSVWTETMRAAYMTWKVSFSLRQLHNS